MVSDVVGNMIYNNEVCKEQYSVPITHRIRRSSSRLSSYSNDVPEPIRIKGSATLCFENNGSSFMGVIDCQDGNFYSILGKKTNKIPEDSSHCDCSSSDSSDDEESLPLLFNIRIKDHDDPTEHILNYIHVHLGKECKFKCPNISFSSKKSYRGHKAQLEAQSCLGRGILSGSDLRVYLGVIDITCFEERNEPRHWVL